METINFEIQSAAPQSIVTGKLLAPESRWFPAAMLVTANEVQKNRAMEILRGRKMELEPFVKIVIV